MKYKKYQYKFLKKYKSITVIEDHFQDGGVSSWLSESVTNSNCKTKIFSVSISQKILGKVGSYKFLMKYLKKSD
jgi:transketolase C-terminal domain/subunit